MLAFGHQQAVVFGRVIYPERRALPAGSLPVLTALEAAGCPEVADAWVEYARCMEGPARNARRARTAASCQRSREIRAWRGNMASSSASEDASRPGRRAVGGGCPVSLLAGIETFAKRDGSGVKVAETGTFNVDEQPA
jgi:hypothetical protein